MEEDPGPGGSPVGRKPGCVFCEIVAGTSPANVRYEDDGIIVIDNLLKWVPVMLLVMPRDHMTQTEFWSGGLMVKAGEVATRLGTELCPGGYRLLSNFGRDALQTQEHGHLHLLGGAHLGLYA